MTGEAKLVVEKRFLSFKLTFWVIFFFNLVCICFPCAESNVLALVCDCVICSLRVCLNVSCVFIKPSRYDDEMPQNRPTDKQKAPQWPDTEDKQPHNSNTYTHANKMKVTSIDWLCWKLIQTWTCYDYKFIHVYCRSYLARSQPLWIYSMNLLCMLKRSLGLYPHPLVGFIAIVIPDGVQIRGMWQLERGTIM